MKAHLGFLDNHPVDVWLLQDPAGREKVIHAEKLTPKGTYYPSVVYAGGYIIVSADGGGAVVMKPGKKPEKVATNNLEGYRSTPILEGSRMYVRGLKNLYCIGGIWLGAVACFDNFIL